MATDETPTKNIEPDLALLKLARFLGRMAAREDYEADLKNKNQ